MPRLPFLPAESLPKETSKTNAPPASELHRILGYNPELLTAWKRFAAAMRDDCVVSRSLRELVTLRVAQLGHSDYMWVEHVPMALTAGVTAEQISDLADWERSLVFSPSEQAVLRMSEAVAAGNLSDHDFTELSGLFTPKEIVELVLTAAFYGLVPRFTQAFAIHPETSC